MTIKPFQPPPRTNDPVEMNKWVYNLWLRLVEAGILDWSQINPDTIALSHQALLLILGASSGTDTVKNKHISDALMKLWEDHRQSIGNPHGATTDSIPQGSTNRYMTKGEASSDATASTVSETTIVETMDKAEVSITSSDASGTYGVGEQALINELKTDFNSLAVKFDANVEDFASLVTKINTALGLVNTLVSNLNSAISSLNDLKQKLRDANHISS